MQLIQAILFAVCISVTSFMIMKNIYLVIKWVFKIIIHKGEPGKFKASPLDSPFTYLIVPILWGIFYYITH